MTEHEINQIKKEAIQSAVWIVRDVWDHDRPDTEFNRGFRKALSTIESLTEHME